MKRIASIVLSGLALIIVLFYAPYNSNAAATPKVKVAGVLMLASDYKAEVLEVLGYGYIQQVQYGPYKTSMFGVPQQDVIIRNADNTIVGVAKSNKKGEFELEVEDSPFFEVTATFKGVKIQKVCSKLSAKNVEIFFGKYDEKEKYFWTVEK
jgi:hypothetical protein